MPGIKVLLATPPMTQINTPYPATAYLGGFLKKHSIEFSQKDMGLELFLSLFSRSGLEKVKDQLEDRYERNNEEKPASRSVRYFFKNASEILKLIDPVVRFLQGKDPTLSYSLCRQGFLPEGPRFKVLKDWEKQGDGELFWAFGALGNQDRAKYLASLFIDDLTDVIREGIDPRFELSRYGEKLAASAPSFDPLLEALYQTPTLVDRLLDSLWREALEKERPDVLALSLPFPGNVYAAFRMAKLTKELFPKVKIAVGGGYVNTELRELQD